MRGEASAAHNAGDGLAGEVLQLNLAHVWSARVADACREARRTLLASQRRPGCQVKRCHCVAASLIHFARAAARLASPSARAPVLRERVHINSSSTPAPSRRLCTLARATLLHRCNNEPAVRSTRTLTAPTSAACAHATHATRNAPRVLQLAAVAHLRAIVVRVHACVRTSSRCLGAVRASARCCFTEPLAATHALSLHRQRLPKRTPRTHDTHHAPGNCSCAAAPRAGNGAACVHAARCRAMGSGRQRSRPGRGAGDAGCKPDRMRPRASPGLIEQHAALSNGYGCTLYGRGAQRLADVPCVPGAIGLRVTMPPVEGKTCWRRAGRSCRVAALN